MKYVFGRKMKLRLMVAIGCVVLAGCGDDEAEPTAAEENAPFVLASDAFEDGGRIESKHTNNQGNVSVPLHWSGTPKGTKSLALYMDDLHPVANGWQHWIVVGIPADATALPEDASRTDQMPAGSKELRNSFGSTGYGGPQPPAGSGDHEYKFVLYALDTDSIDFPDRVSADEFQELIDGHVLGTAELSGFYENP